MATTPAFHAPDEMNSGLKVATKRRGGVLLPEHAEPLQFRHNAVRKLGKGIRQECRGYDKAIHIAGREDVSEFVGDLFGGTTELRHQYALAVLAADLAQVQ